MLLRLQQVGIVPQKHVMDNKISEAMKEHIRDECKVNLELVPPGCHQRNAAEVAIHNFKAHFLSVLAGVADDFPPSLWDRLLPQTKITLNLLRQSNSAPNISAYAHLSGPFDYKKCHSRRWMQGTVMKKPIRGGHGHTTPSTDGI